MNSSWGVALPEHKQIDIFFHLKQQKGRQGLVIPVYKMLRIRYECSLIWQRKRLVKQINKILRTTDASVRHKNALKMNIQLLILLKGTIWKSGLFRFWIVKKSYSWSDCSRPPPQSPSHSASLFIVWDVLQYQGVARHNTAVTTQQAIFFLLSSVYAT